MPVTTTPNDILAMAYAKSLKNRPGSIAAESTELLSVVNRALRGLYTFAARVNPTYFAESAVVPLAGGGWARPAAAESIYRVEDATGVEVVIVGFDDRRAESGKPAVYEFGQVFRPASANAPDPQAGSLTFFYARRPTDAANLAPATLDAQWVESFNELLALEVAIYLAIKEGNGARGDEVGNLRTDRDKWAQLFVAHLEHATSSVRRRWGHIQRFNVNTLVPLHSILAGGQPTPPQAA